MHDEDTARCRKSEEQQLKAVIERYEGRPNQCTIYQPCESDVEQMSSWITADEDSFYHLQTVR